MDKLLEEAARLERASANTKSVALSILETAALDAKVGLRRLGLRTLHSKHRTDGLFPAG
jgi:hypothetical protein